MKEIYLDNNATTRVDDAVFAEMRPYFCELYGNPSSMHFFGGQVQKKVDEARARVASLLGAQPEEVIFTEGSIGERFYLVLEGEVELRRGHYTKPGSFNVRIKHGSVLGEMAFLLHAPRSMTAVAAVPCKLIEIDRERFDELLEANLTAPYKLIRNIAIALAERLHALDSSHQKLLETRGGGAQ